jgi:hypothetical protein
MLIPTRFRASLVVFAAAMSFTGEGRALDVVARSATGSAPQTVGLPGTGFEIAPGSAAFEPGSTRIKPELLRAIVGWLSSNYGFEPIDAPPAVAFATRAAMAAIRHRDLRDNRSTSQAAIDHGGSPHASTVVAIYDDVARTIYLPETWTGSTPTELSILVHEMVHHLQNLAGMTFACHEERERLAYAAQRDWLTLFGHDLFTDFDTDAFTLMARTHCAH